MAPAALLSTCRKRLQEFRTAQGGNVVLTFTLALIAIIGFVSTAVDYSRGNSARSAIQSAADSTATNPTMYYDVQQASQLNGVFTAIAQNLANLRIAK